MDGRLFSRPFLVTLLTSFLYFLCIGTIAPELPRYVVDRLHGGAVAAGLAVGVYTLTACVTRSAAGRLCVRYGVRVVILLGIAIAGGSIMLYSVAGALAALVAFRMVTGVGQANAYVGLAKFSYDAAPPGRSPEAISYFTAALFAGMALGPLIGEAVRQEAGFRAVWFVAGGFVFAAFIVAFWFLPRHAPISGGDSIAIAAVAPGAAPLGAGLAPQPAVRDARLSWRRRVIQPDALAPSAIVAVSMSGYAAVSTVIPLYVSHIGVSSAGPVLAENAAVILFVRLTGARFPNRFSPAVLGSLSFSLQMTGWLIVAVVDNAAGLYVGMAFVALGVAALYPTMFSLAIARAPVAERAFAVGTFTMFGDLAAGFGALGLGGLVSLTGDARAAFLCAAAVNLCSLVAILAKRHLTAPMARLAQAAP